MPQIPNFVATQQVGAARLDTGLAGAPFEAMAAGVESVGATVAAFGEQYMKARRAAESSNAKTGLTKELGDLEFKWSQVPDRQQAYAGFQKEAAALRKQRLDGIGDSLVRADVAETFDWQAATRGLQTQDAAFRLEASARRADLQENLLAASQAASTARSNALRMQIIDNAHEGIDSAVTAGWINPETGQEAKAKFASDVQQLTARQDIDANPSAALAKLKAEGTYSGLMPDDRQTLIERADAEVERQRAEAEARAREAQAVAQANQRDLLRDELAAAQNEGTRLGLVSEKSLTAAFGADKAKVILADLDATAATATAATELALQSPEQRRATLDRYKPAPGVGYADASERYKALVTADAQLAKLRADDPAGYTMAYSDAVKKAYLASDADPTNAEKLSAAVTLSLQTQADAGVPATQRRVLSLAEAGEMVQRITAGDPQAAADAMDGLAQRYGGHWPRVYGELVVAKLPPPYSVLATAPEQFPARKVLAEQLRDPEGARKAVAPVASDVDEAVDDALARFAATLAYSPDGPRLVQNYRDAARLVAYSYALRSDPSAAAQQAVTELIDAKYDYAEGDNFNARAPKNAGDLAEAVASYTLEHLNAGELADPGAPFGELALPELKAERKAAYLEQVRHGTWVTNADDTGWILLDSIGQPVELVDGSIVSFRFADMAHMPRLLSIMEILQ